MKKSRIMILLIVLLASLPMCVILSAVDNRVEILLTSSMLNDDEEDLMTDISSDNTPMTRGLFAPIHAYLSESIVTVSFEMDFEAITILIVDENMGVVTYQETRFCPGEWKIDLSNEEKGDFLLRIETGHAIYEGYFSL